MLLGIWVFNKVDKEIGIVPWQPNHKEDLEFIEELFEAGKIKPIIDKQYPLGEISEAFWYLKKGHAQGKVVITM